MFSSEKNFVSLGALLVFPFSVCWFFRQVEVRAVVVGVCCVNSYSIAVTSYEFFVEKISRFCLIHVISFMIHH